MPETMQYVEDMERFMQQAADLLGQVDQLLQQQQTAIDNFASAHDMNRPSADTLKEAMADVKKMLTGVTEQHTTFENKLREARAQAEQHARAGDYQPDSL